MATASIRQFDASFLNRIPLIKREIDSEGKIYSVSAIDKVFPITAKDIGKATSLDPVLTKVFDFIMTGWPESCEEENLKPYYTRKNELSSEQNCVLWGFRVIISQVYREKILKELHWEHPGICAMKAIARTCMWLAKMDEEIEREIKLCTACQNTRSPPPTPSAPLIPWKWPARPLQCIHIDFYQ